MFCGHWPHTQMRRHARMYARMQSFKTLTNDNTHNLWFDTNSIDPSIHPSIDQEREREVETENENRNE